MEPNLKFLEKKFKIIFMAFSSGEDREIGISMMRGLPPVLWIYYHEWALFLSPKISLKMNTFVTGYMDVCCRDLCVCVCVCL